jgi:hypothetical protein
VTDPPTEPITASLIFGVALARVTEGWREEAALAELLAEAEGSYHALEGAYGRGVALLGEYPDDRTLHETIALLAKALRRFPRPVWPWSEDVAEGSVRTA